jgi:hypothetical protein
VHDLAKDLVVTTPVSGDACEFVGLLSPSECDLSAAVIRDRGCEFDQNLGSLLDKRCVVD